ncbi:MAG: ABC transporter ATP-binding protein [Actinomycetota bacterium]|nr:ABC transporter ATP-binding protein [Actinomycetota bacterium]
MSAAVIQVRELRKSYGAVEAVRGIDLEVHRQEIFAVLGPNGAGKTTTVEILEGYRARNGGEVEVLGTDPAHATPEWRARIGVVLQSCELQPLLTVRESLDLYAGYYPSPLAVPEVIDLVGLAEQRDKRAGRLSGGQQRRLDVALALIGDPELIFLDEPTTGFDPAARRDAWEMIANLRQLGKAVLLTTHYMEEAQVLADRAAIIKDGRIVAEGRPGELGGDRRKLSSIRFRLPPGTGADRLPASAGSAAKVTPDGGVQITTEAPVTLLTDLLAWARQSGVDLEDLEVRRSSLEDVYLELTAS